QAQQTLPKTDRLERVNCRLHTIQTIVETPIATAQHGLAVAEQFSEHPGAELGLPGRCYPWLEVPFHEIERILSSGLADRRETDRGIEDFSRKRGLPALLKIISRMHDTSAGKNRHHEFAFILHWGDRRRPSQTVGQGQRGAQTPSVLGV